MEKMWMENFITFKNGMHTVWDETQSEELYSSPFKQDAIEFLQKYAEDKEKREELEGRVALEEGKLYTRDLLQNGKVEIAFTKQNGQERKMTCTLNGKLIPEDKWPSGNGRPSPEDVQRVFDIEKGEWRSFIWDSVYNVRVVNEK